MQKPKITKLKVDPSETKKIRKLANVSRAVKITINIDAATLAKLKSEAAKTGVPYQRLLNQVLQSSLRERSDSESRLEKLEREVASIRRKLAA